MLLNLGRYCVQENADAKWEREIERDAEWLSDSFI